MNFSKLPNDDLYQMCLRGEESAWAYVYNYVLCIARSPRWGLRDTPEDMAQSIVCHLLNQGIDNVRKHTAFRSFVKRVSINFILDSFKKKQIPLQVGNQTDSDRSEQLPDPPSNNPGPEEMVLSNELARIIGKAIGMLSQKCQVVLNAYVDYKFGYFQSYKALAEHFGKSIGTLSSQVKRCLDQLRGIEEIREWLG